MKCTSFKEEKELILFYFKKKTLVECDIDNAESNNIKEREYDLDHNLLIKDIDNFMLK